MNLKMNKFTALVGILSVGLMASGCGDAKQTPIPPPDKGGGDGPISKNNQRPNLRVTRFDPTVRADGTVRAVVEVANTGLAPSGKPSRVTIRHIAEKGQQIMLGDATVPALESGQTSKPLVIIVPRGKLKASKSILLCAYADFDKVIKEGTEGETDNHTDQEIFYGPDLVVKEIQKEQEEDPSRLSLIASLGNTGNVNAGAFNATWLYQVREASPSKDKKEDELWKVITVQNVPGLRINTRKPVELKLDFPQDLAKGALQGKTVVVQLVLDRGDKKIDELDNSNNSNGKEHAFPPALPDLNAWGLLAWWNRAEAKLHFHSFVTNTGVGALQQPEFESQWFRAPGVNDLSGGPTFSSGTDDGWVAMSPVLKHKAAEAERPWGLDKLKQNPEFAYIPEIKEEGQVLALRYEVDPYGKINEEGDAEANAARNGAAGAPGSPITTGTASSPTTTGTTGPAAAGTTGPEAQPGQLVRLGRNAPNNSFVWNFRVPRFQVANLRLMSVEPQVSEDREKLQVQVNVGNYGTIGSGNFKIVASLDGKQKVQEVKNLPPGWMVFSWPFEFDFTRAQRKAGTAALQVRIEPSRKNRTEDALQIGRKIEVPDGKLGGNVMFSRVEIDLLRLGRDPQRPWRTDTLMIYYRVRNTGDKPSGALTVNVSVEGGPSDVQNEKDGIPIGHVYPGVFLLDISKMGQPNKSTPIKFTLTLNAEDDRDKTDNTLVFQDGEIGPIDPPRPLPDLVVTDIRPAAKNNQAVGTFRMLSTIANIGPGASSNFWVKWWVNGKMVYRGGVGALQPKSATNAFDGNICNYKLQPGDKKLSVLVIVDPDGEVAELSGQNNRRSAELDKDDFHEGKDPKPTSIPDPSKGQKDADDEA